MLLPNHPRLRFALKLLLAVTFPIWVFALIPIAVVALVGIMVWESVCDIVDGRPSRGLGAGR
jgi:hypothetical protein